MTFDPENIFGKHAKLNMRPFNLRCLTMFYDLIFGAIVILVLNSFCSEFIVCLSAMVHLHGLFLYLIIAYFIFDFFCVGL